MRFRIICQLCGRSKFYYPAIDDKKDVQSLRWYLFNLGMFGVTDPFYEGTEIWICPTCMEEFLLYPEREEPLFKFDLDALKEKVREVLEIGRR